MLIRYMGYVQDVAQGLIYIKERLISLGEQEEGMLKLYGSMEPEFDIWDL